MLFGYIQRGWRRKAENFLDVLGLNWYTQERGGSKYYEYLRYLVAVIWGYYDATQWNVGREP